MLVLGSGNYTGSITQQQHIDDCVLTNTEYSHYNNSDWHYHKNIHISFVYQGGRAETKKKLSYTKTGGSVFFYNAEEKHRWISPLPLSKSLNLEIGTTFIKKFNLSAYTIAKAIKNNPDTRALMLKIQRETHKSLKDDSQILTLLLELMTEKENTSYLTIPYWVTQVKEVLNDNWQNHLSLIEIASIVNVHPVTISKNFRKYFSYSFGDYRRKLQIERSIDYIKNSNASLSEIAHICNFSDQSHFTRSFKIATGFLPKVYRAY